MNLMSQEMESIPDASAWVDGEKEELVPFSWLDYRVICGIVEDLDILMRKSVSGICTSEGLPMKNTYDDVVVQGSYEDGTIVTDGYRVALKMNENES